MPKFALLIASVMLLLLLACKSEDGLPPPENRGPEDGVPPVEEDGGPEDGVPPVEDTSAADAIPSALTQEQLQAIIDRVVGLQEPSTATAPTFEGTRSVATMFDFIQLVMDGVNSFWSDAFTQAGTPYSPPSFVVLDQGDAPEFSNCIGDPATPDSGPFYCQLGGQFGSQGTIYTPVVYFGAPWMYTEMSQVQPDNFDFAVASVVAHEFGHHIQYLLLSAGTLDPESLPGKWRELSADCLSGVWANAAYYAGQLQDTDVEEAMTAAWNAGSDLPLPEGTPGDHGTRDERAAAFEFGYDNGDALACLS